MEITNKENKSGFSPFQVAQENRKRKIPNVKKVIAVGSGKGGVGKSTVTSLLAASAKKQNKSVGILDADIYGPSIPMMFGVDDDKGWAVNKFDKLIPKKSCDIEIASFGFLMNDHDPVIWRGPMVVKAFLQLCFQVAWSDLDILFIDLPPGTGDIQLSLSQDVHFDGAIIVSTPQDVALLDATKGIKMFQKMNVPVLGMIENMAYHECAQCGFHDPIFGLMGVKNLAEQEKVPLLGRLPLLSKIRQACDDGIPILFHEKNKMTQVENVFENILANII